MAYGISSRDENQKPLWITSSEIRGMLDPTVHAKQIARIDEIEAKGIRYSGEDFDVLSSALSAARSA